VLAVLLALAPGTLQGVSGADSPQAQPAAGQTPARFGGAYSGLDPRRQQLVKDWVARFSEVLGRRLEPGPFYDEQITLSQKTTFDAITYALMVTPLTDESARKWRRIVHHRWSIRSGTGPRRGGSAVRMPSASSRTR
jgi:hypothetical protein